MKLQSALCAFLAASYATAFSPAKFIGGSATQLSVAVKSDEVPTEADVVIIGSGLAGLSCGALLSHCKKNGTNAFRMNLGVVHSSLNYFYSVWCSGGARIS